MGKASRKKTKAEGVVAGESSKGPSPVSADRWPMKKGKQQHLRLRPDRTGLLYKPLVHILLVAVVGLLAYSNTFHSPFQWDEEQFIQGNPVVRDLSYFADTSKAMGYEYYGALRSRYMGYLTFALNYRIHGLEVTGYHVVNLFIHLLNAALVYFFVLLTFRTPFLRDQVPPVSDQRSASGDRRFTVFIALFTSLFFVAHPLQTEAVTYVFQRLASLVGMFYLLSLVLYIKGRLAGEQSAVGDQRSEEIQNSRIKIQNLKLKTLNPVIFYLMSLLSAILAMKTKENAFTLPVVIALYELLFFSGPLKTRILRLAPFLLTMLIIPSTLFLTGRPAGEVINLTDDIASAGYQGISRSTYLLTQCRVLLTYVRLLFLPVHQNIDYEYPLSHSLFTPPVLFSIIFLGALFGTAVYLVYKSRRRAMGYGQEEKNKEQAVVSPIASYRLIAFGIFWFFITISVESSVIPIHMVINEYRVYLPSVGAFTAIITAVFLLMARSGGVVDVRKEKLAISILILVTLVLASATYARNTLWKDSVSLWEDVVRKSPESPRGYYNLGLAYFEKGRYEKAIDMYEKAIALKPSYWEAYTNRGYAFSEIGQNDKAIADFDKAIALNPSYALAYYNRGIAYVKTGRFNDAIDSFTRATAARPDYAEAYNNRGFTYTLINQRDKALEDFNKAISLSHSYPKAHVNRGNVYLKTGNRALALPDFQRACDLGDKQGCDMLRAAGRE